jgi:hypothetical protein
MPAVGKLREENLEFETSLFYIVFCFKKQNKNNNIKIEDVK